MVTGWSIKMDVHSKQMVYDISFKRLPDQISMTEVLARPWTEEIEDYKEYKRLRQTARDKQAEAAKAKKEVVKPTVTVSADGSAEIFEDDATDSILEHSSDESEPGWEYLRRGQVEQPRPSLRDRSVSPKTRI